jgi:hypothetical protein
MENTLGGALLVRQIVEYTIHKKRGFAPYFKRSLIESFLRG